MIAQIARNAHHFIHCLLVAELFGDVSAHRVAAGKEFFRKRLIDDDDPWSCAGVLRSDLATSQHLHANCGEIGWTNLVKAGAAIFLGLRSEALNFNKVCRLASGKQAVDGVSCPGDAW